MIFGGILSIRFPFALKSVGGDSFHSLAVLIDNAHIKRDTEGLGKDEGVEKRWKWKEGEVTRLIDRRHAILPQHSTDDALADPPSKRRVRAQCTMLSWQPSLFFLSFFIFHYFVEFLFFLN
jgi:hypothetical protein